MNRSDILVEATRHEDTRYGSASVSVKIHLVGDEDQYKCLAYLSETAYDGNDFEADDTFDLTLYGKTLSEKQLALDAVKAFMGRADELTVSNVKTAIERSPRGFFDTRTYQWRHIEDAQKNLYLLRTPYIDWYDENSDDASKFADLKEFYADDLQSAKKVAYQRFLDADRLDMIEYSVSFYDEGHATGYKVPWDVVDLFATAPERPEPEPVDDEVDPAVVEFDELEGAEIDGPFDEVDETV